MDPVSLLFSGGAGGLTLAPSSTATSGRVDNRLNFGSSAVSIGPTTAGSVLPLAVIGATLLLGLYIWKKVK